MSHLITHKLGTFLREPELPICHKKTQGTITFTIRDQTTGRQLTVQGSLAATSVYGNVLGGVFGSGHCLFKALQLEAKERVRTKYQL